MTGHAPTRKNLSPMQKHQTCQHQHEDFESAGAEAAMGPERYPASGFVWCRYWIGAAGVAAHLTWF